MPDAELIPSIADTLGVTIDMLFGRSRSSSTEDAIIRELSLLDSKARFKKAFMLLCAIGTGISGYESDSINEEELEKMATAIPPALDGGSRLPKA